MVDGLFAIPPAGQHVVFGRGALGPSKQASLRDFVFGPENQLAAVAVQAILEASNPGYAPMLLYGPSGTGKSHLAWGILSAWRGCFSRQSAVCTTAIEFAQELADAIDAQTVDDFREKYLRASLLVVEDVGLLAGKPAAQEELADILDALVDGGSWVLVSACALPAQLPGISPRLQSRLAAGLTVPLTHPSLPTRIELIRRLADQREMRLAPDAIRALAEGLQGSVADFSGAIVRLAASARADGATIDVDRIRRFLSERSGARQPSLRSIASLTARRFSLRVAELQSASRCRSVVTARGVAMYLARTMTDRSLAQIGRFFGGRDHTTVSHGCRKTQELLEAEPAIRQLVYGLRERLLQTA